VGDDFEKTGRYSKGPSRMVLLENMISGRSKKKFRTGRKRGKWGGEENARTGGDSLGGGKRGGNPGSTCHFTIFFPLMARGYSTWDGNRREPQKDCGRISKKKKTPAQPGRHLGGPASILIKTVGKGGPKKTQSWGPRGCGIMSSGRTKKKPFRGLGRGENFTRKKGGGPSPRGQFSPFP